MKMAAREGNFTAATKRILAQRSAYLCSNPNCRNLTISPHSSPDKSISTGEAGHINSAKPGGPRYDEKQSDEERRSISNAIWLCTNCHTRVDRDASGYAEVELRAWKQRHEEWIRQRGIIPSLPELKLVTLQGFAVPDMPGNVRASDLGDMKEQSLLLRNRSDTVITSIVARIQLPEPVISGKERCPPGRTIAFMPIRPEMRFIGSPGASVTRGRPPLPTHLHSLHVDSLAPGEEIELRLQTSMQVWKAHNISYTDGLWAGMNDPPRTMYFFDGTYQFELHGAFLAKGVFAPINYDAKSREMKFEEIRGDYGDWKIVEGHVVFIVFARLGGIVLAG